MQVFTHPEFDGHEQVVYSSNRVAGFRSIIAIHDTTLGPALGGCRIWKYESEEDALADVLRLSRGMTYKAALAGLALGGGKSVILADARTEKTPEMMRAMGRAVERLGGRYIVAEDVGATVEDMDLIATETAHVSGVSTGAGDPSPWTAKGVFLSMAAAARHRWSTELAGRTVAVTGLGSVGSALCEHLHAVGAKLVISDIHEPAIKRIRTLSDAEVAAPDEIHAAKADIFAPCALGAILNEETIPEIQAAIVCGAANNQLATPEDGDRIHDRDILYAPDYLVNAGGLISVSRRKLGLSDEDATEKLAAIPGTLTEILQVSDAEKIPPAEAADRIAESRFR